MGFLLGLIVGFVLGVVAVIGYCALRVAGWFDEQDETDEAGA
jgi:hypothetical protein